MKQIIIVSMLLSAASFAQPAYYESFLGYFKSGTCTDGQKVSATAKIVKFGANSLIEFSIVNSIGQKTQAQIFLADTRISSSDFVKAVYGEYVITNDYYRIANSGAPAKTMRLARSATSNRVRIGVYDGNKKLSQECVFYR